MLHRIPISRLATDCFTNKDDAHPKPLSVDYFTNKDDPYPSPLSVDYCTSAVDLPHIAPPVASSSSYGQVANLPHTAAFVLVGDADASLLPIQKSSL